MPNHLVPVLLLVVFPALYFAGRLGWLRHRGVRWLGGGALAAAVVLSLPYEGVDPASLKNLKLLLAGAAGGLLWLRHLRVPWLLERGREVAVLTPLALLSSIVYFNFFAFHTEWRFVHLHDVAHYYLGSKYFGELGYSDLYTAMLRAELEVYGDVQTSAVRDLETNQVVPVQQLVLRSDAVKGAFSGERWAEFRREVAYFREAMGPRYGELLLDHGFNPTPVWALLGGTVSGWIDVGSEQGRLSLTLLDLILLAGLFAAVGSTFGRRTLLLTVIYFSVIFGTTFEWTGGALLRYPWLVAAGMGTCFLRRKRYLRAGALFAAAAMLRVFPVVLIVPLAFKALSVAWRRRALPPRYRAFFGGFAAAAALLFLASGVLPRGLGHWREFGANISLHAGSPSSNTVGLTELLTYRDDAADSTGMTFQAFNRARQELKERRHQVRRVQLVLVFLPLLVVVARLSRWQTDLGAVWLALPLLFAGLTLSAYYYVVLVILLLVHRRSPHHLALLFTVEAATYTLLLFEDRQILIFWVYRGLLIAFLYLALLLPLLRRDRRLAAAARSAGARLAGQEPSFGINRRPVNRNE